MNKISSIKFSFVHLDFDLYQPTIDCMNFLNNRLEKDAIVLIPAGEGKIGFMPFMPYTKAKDGVEIDMKWIMFMVDPIEEMVEQHRNATSQIAIPEKKIIS